MFCDSCGTKNRENAKFCIKCGQSFNENDFQEEIENTDSGIRKAIKRKASKFPKGNLSAGIVTMALLLLANSLFFYFVSGLSIFEDDLPLELDIVSTIMYSLICSILILGILNTGFKVARNSKVKFRNTFLYPLEHPRRLLCMFIIFSILNLIGIGTGFLSIFLMEMNDWSYWILWLLLILVFIYIYPLIDMLGYVLSDEKVKYKNFFKTLKFAYKLVKGRRKEYYALVCSFIPWQLLGVLTFGILYIWLYPYITLSKVNLYRKWQKEEVFNSDEKGFSNEAVIGISVGGIIAGIVVAFFTTVAIIAIVDPDFLEEEEEKTITMSGEAHLKNDYVDITFKVPLGYDAASGNNESHQEFIDKEDGDIIYSLEFKISDYYEINKKSAKEFYSSEYDNVEVEDFTTIINGKEVKGFFIDMEDDEYIYRITYAFYPASDNYYVFYFNNDPDITKDNLKKYMVVKKGPGEDV